MPRNVFKLTQANNTYMLRVFRQRHVGRSIVAISRVGKRRPSLARIMRVATTTSKARLVRNII